MYPENLYVFVWSVQQAVNVKWVWFGGGYDSETEHSIGCYGRIPNHTHHFVKGVYESELQLNGSRGVNICQKWNKRSEKNAKY